MQRCCNGFKTWSHIREYFMRLFEKILLENCPEKFKPAVYRSYVDTFLFFRSTEHVGNF